MVLAIDVGHRGRGALPASRVGDDVGHDRTCISACGCRAPLRADMSISIYALAHLQDTAVHHHPWDLDVALPPILFTFSCLPENCIPFHGGVQSSAPAHLLGLIVFVFKPGQYTREMLTAHSDISLVDQRPGCGVLACKRLDK